MAGLLKQLILFASDNTLLHLSPGKTGVQRKEFFFFLKRMARFVPLPAHSASNTDFSFSNYLKSKDCSTPSVLQKKSTKFWIFLMEACRVNFVLKKLEVDMLRKKKGDYGLIPFSPEGSSTENFRISGTVWALNGRAGTTSEEAESRLTWNNI